MIGIENPSPKTNSRQKVDIFSTHHQPVLVQWVISLNYLPCCRSALIFWVQSFWEFVQSDFAIFFIIWFSIFWVQDIWEIVQSDFAEHPTLFFNSASTAKQRVNMNFVLRSVSWFHALACTLLKTLSRGHNISRWSLHHHWVTMPKVFSVWNRVIFKKIFLLLMLTPDTQKA